MADEEKPSDKAPSPAPDDFQFPDLHSPEATPAPTQSALEPTPDAPKFKKDYAALLAKHRTVALLAAFLVVAGSMWGLRKVFSDAGPEVDNPTPTGIEEIPVNAVEAHLGRFQDVISAVGTLKGEVEVELRFQVEGRLEELNLVEGQKVRKGQVLARISDNDAKLKVDRAKIELEQAEKLFQIGGISRTALEEKRLNLAVAQSELDKTRIIASRDGIIGEKEAEIGEFVNPQKKIAKLVSIKNVVVEVGIIERDVDKVYPGQKMLIKVDAYPGNIFEGTIETISPIIGADSSKTFSIRSKIPNPDSLLLPGMFARTDIITYEDDNAISVQNDALTKTPSGFQVFVIDKDNVAHARDVQVGYMAHDTAKIDSGLSAGEMVVVQKPAELQDGKKVRIIEMQR